MSISGRCGGQSLENLNEQEVETFRNLVKNNQIPQDRLGLTIQIMEGFKERGIPLTPENITKGTQLAIAKNAAREEKSQADVDRKIGSPENEFNARGLINNLDMTQEQKNRVEDELQTFFDQNMERLQNEKLKNVTLDDVHRTASNLNLSMDELSARAEQSNLNAEEMYLMMDFIADQRNRIEEIRQDIKDAKEAGNDSRVDALVDDLIDVEATHNMLFEGWMKVGSEWGLQGRVRQEEFNGRLAEMQRISTAVAQNPQLELTRLLDQHEIQKRAYKRYVTQQIRQLYNKQAEEAGEPGWEEALENDREMANAWGEINPMDWKQVNEFLRKHAPVPLDQKFRQLFLTNVLSGPRTMFRNIIGSSAITAHRYALNKPGLAAADFIANILDHPAAESASMKEARAGQEIRNAMKEQGMNDKEIVEYGVLHTAMKQASQAGMNAWNHGLAPEMGKITDYWVAPPPQETTFQKALYTPLYMMSFQDQFIRSLNSEIVRQREAVYQAQLESDNRQEYLELLVDYYENPGKIENVDVVGMMEQAASEGVAQFGESTILENTFGKIREVRDALFEQGNNMDDDFLGMFSKFAMFGAASQLEFMRTMGSLLRTGIRNTTPAGAAFAFNDMLDTKEAMENQELSDSELREQMTKFRQARRDLAASAAGTAFTGTLMLASIWGLGLSVTGGGPDDRRKLYELMREEDFMPYSIQFTEPFSGEVIQVGYRDMAPYDIPFTAIGEITDEARHGTLSSDEFYDLTRDISTGIASTGTKMFDKSFSVGLQRVALLLSGGGYGKDSQELSQTFHELWKGPVQGMIPLVGLQRTVAQSLDPQLKKSPQNAVDHMKEAFLSSIPGLSKFVEPETDEFGNPIEFSQPFGGAGTFVAPAVGLPSQDIDSVRENVRIDETIGEIDQKFLEAEKANNRNIFDVDLEEYNLTDDQKNWLRAEWAFKMMTEKPGMLVNKAKMSELTGPEAARQFRQWYNKMREKDGYNNETFHDYLTEIMATEKGGFPLAGGNKLYKRDRELINYRGDYLVRRVHDRLTGYDDPERRVQKRRQLMAYFMTKMWSDLDKEERKNKRKRFIQKLLKRDQITGERTVFQEDD